MWNEQCNEESGRPDSSCLKDLNYFHKISFKLAYKGLNRLRVALTFWETKIYCLFRKTYLCRRDEEMPGSYERYDDDNWPKQRVESRLSESMRNPPRLNLLHLKQCSRRCFIRMSGINRYSDIAPHTPVIEWKGRVTMSCLISVGYHRLFLYTQATSRQPQSTQGKKLLYSKLIPLSTVYHEKSFIKTI